MQIHFLSNKKNILSETLESGYFLSAFFPLNWSISFSIANDWTKLIYWARSDYGHAINTEGNCDFSIDMKSFWK